MLSKLPACRGADAAIVSSIRTLTEKQRQLCLCIVLRNTA